MMLQDKAIPVKPAVAAAGEFLGLDAAIVGTVLGRFSPLRAKDHRFWWAAHCGLAQWRAVAKDLLSGQCSGCAMHGIEHAIELVAACAYCTGASGTSIKNTDCPALNCYSRFL
jgi:hypothetical protein